MARSSARVPIGYIRDRTATYREKWNALHPKCAPPARTAGPCVPLPALTLSCSPF